ncbi:MAG: MmcQ/YjbR family DNA-binding protein [Agriterribacter sp.]
MVTIQTFRELALAFPGTTEEPHFEKTSFRVKKKIFATYDEANNRACVKLSVTDQDVFCKIDPAIIYRVPNKWGLQGWTLIEMKTVRKQIFKEVLEKAYRGVSEKV